MSKKAVKFVAMQGKKKVLEGQTKNFRTNKPVLDIARKALIGKLQGKKQLCRVAIIRDDKKVGEWTCAPSKKSKKAA